MPEVVRVRELWNSRIKGQVRCLVISSDGQYIFVGSKEGMLYSFSRSGQLRWKTRVGEDVSFLALAEDQRCLLVGGGRGKALHALLWNYEGKLLQTLQADGAVSHGVITPTADFIALGTGRQALYLFDESGHLLWQRAAGGAVKGLSMTPDGQFITLASMDRSFSVFNQSGDELWRYKADGQISTDIAMDVMATLIAAGSVDKHVYLLDHDGHLLQKRLMDGYVHAVVLTPDTQYMAVAGDSRQIHLFRPLGTPVWPAPYQASAAIYALALSFDGLFLVAGTADHQVYLFDREGHCLWRQKMLAPVPVVALTPNGRLFAAASQDQMLGVYENLEASEDFSGWLPRTIRWRVRQAFSKGALQGLSCWFNEFDRALCMRLFALCDALLKEVREQGHVLQREELAYIDSREAALLLCRGIVHRRRGELNEARQAYEQSLQIQKLLQHDAGMAQVDTALEELQQKNETVIRSLFTRPRVLGHSYELLSRHLITSSTSGQIQVIIAAKNAGYLSPLEQALTSGEPAEQVAAAALSWLKPGPGEQTLLTMLSSPRWMLRWQALLLLQQKAKDVPESFAAYRDRIHASIVQRILTIEVDPTILVVMAQVLQQIGDAVDTPVLVHLLSDRDNDVLLAAIDALERIGDRRALPLLRKQAEADSAQDTAIQRVVHTRALEAAEHIEERYPIFEVKKVALCKTVTKLKEPTQAATIFFAFVGPIYCVVTISLPEPNARVTCRWKEGGANPSYQQEEVLTAIDALSSPLIEILSSTIIQPSASMVQAPKSNHVVFQWMPRRGRWLPGEYSVQVLLNGEMQTEQTFTIIDQVRIMQVQTCIAVESEGTFLVPFSDFPRFIPAIYCAVMLNEAPVGVELVGDIYRADSDTETLVARKKAQTKTEGRNIEVHLVYDTAQWEVGRYNLFLLVAGHRSSCSFSITSSPLLTE